MGLDDINKIDSDIIVRLSSFKLVVSTNFYILDIGAFAASSELNSKNNLQLHHSKINNLWYSVYHTYFDS